MRENIHPAYPTAKVHCACGATWETRSTHGDLHLDICSNCHPFFTGTQKLMDTQGRIDRFKKKYANAPAAPAKKKAAAPAPKKDAAAKSDKAKKAKKEAGKAGAGTRPGNAKGRPDGTGRPFFFHGPRGGIRAPGRKNGGGDCEGEGGDPAGRVATARPLTSRGQPRGSGPPRRGAPGAVPGSRAGRPASSC